MKKIRIDTLWRYGSDVDRIGSPIFYPGVYRVPTDISAELAKRALSEGIAVDISKEEDAIPLTVASMPKATRKTGKTRGRTSKKGPAPWNKSRGKAKHNKAAME